MKIVFLCGSFEPGLDGVGDYTRRLAEEIVSKGHEAAVVAINDKYLIKEFAGIQHSGNVELPVFRMPSIWSPEDRFRHAKVWIDEWNPEWLSLQFVVFAYHPKGLPFDLGKRLVKLGGKRRWHVMFHELWVGMAENDTVKLKLLGHVQKLLIKHLINKLKPEVIHTQCDLFVEQLEREACPIKKLPLFSNIEYHGTTTSASGDLEYSPSNNEVMRFVCFGGLHPGAKLYELISGLKKNTKEDNRAYEFLYIGRNGDELSNHLYLLDREKVRYKVMGELEPADISYLFSVSSYGIATASPEVLEKSGSVAAMLDHGLPVICIGRSLRFKKIPELNRPDGVYLLQDMEQLLTRRPVVEARNRLSTVAAMFVNDMSSLFVKDRSRKFYQPE